jgi:stearoyl-CoA desaturase (delta-9 desaturase)
MHVCTHALTIFGIIWAISNAEYYWLLISFLFFLYAGIIGVNISLHRYYAHRSFKTGPIRDIILLISSFMPLLGSPAAWGSIHSYHHKTSDTKNDPHCPKNSSWIKIWFTSWPRIKIPYSIFKRFVNDKKVYFLHKYYFTSVILYALVLLLIDWKLLVFVMAIPAVGCFHGASAIAVIPHLNTWGSYRNHSSSDNSRNSFIAWILSLGEGWHNNHHHNPRNYRSGEKWWELDHSAFIIKHFLMKDGKK